MNIITIAAVAIVSAISAVAIKKHNGEISLMLSNCLRCNIAYSRNFVCGCDFADGK